MTKKQNNEAYYEIAGQFARTEHFLGILSPANAFRNVRRKLSWLTRADFDARYILLGRAYDQAKSDLLLYLRPTRSATSHPDDIDTEALLRALSKAYPTIPRRALTLMLGMIVYFGYLR